MNVEYLTLIEVLEIHHQLIDRYGGAEGLREPGALESALIRPQMGYYNTLAEQTAALMESLVQNHPFVDGNKRVAFAVGDTFLRLNGYKITGESLVVYQTWMGFFEQGEFNYASLLNWLDKAIQPL